MKSIVRCTLLVVMIVSLAASVTMAQRARHGQSMSMSMMPGLQQNPLTQQQRQDIAGIRQQTQQQVRDVRMDRNLSQQQKDQKISQIRSQGHERVMNVLTPQQQAEFRNWWQQRGNCAGGACTMRRPSGAGAGPGMRGGGMGMGMNMNQMSTIPGLQQHPLTDQQSQQIAGIRRNTREQMSAVTNDTSLTQDQKWQRIQQIQRESHDSIVSVLTPEQQQELSDWWSSHPASGVSSSQPGTSTNTGTDSGDMNQ